MLVQEKSTSGKSRVFFLGCGRATPESFARAIESDLDHARGVRDGAGFLERESQVVARGKGEGGRMRDV